MQLSRRSVSRKRKRTLTQDEAFADWSSELIGPTPNPFAPGTDVYTLPVGTKLFHGAPHHVNAVDVLKRPNFFGDWRTASLYHLSKDDGRCIHCYTVIRPIVVLAIDSCRTVRTGWFGPNESFRLRSLENNGDLWTPPDTFNPNNLTSAFRCVDERPRPMRSSLASRDRILIPAIAHVPGTVGVAAKQLRAAEPDTANFHAEIYLVKPCQYVRADHWLSCLPRDVFSSKKE